MTHRVMPIAVSQALKTYQISITIESDLVGNLERCLGERKLK